MGTAPTDGIGLAGVPSLCRRSGGTAVNFGGNSHGWLRAQLSKNAVVGGPGDDFDFYWGRSWDCLCGLVSEEVLSEGEMMIEETITVVADKVLTVWEETIDELKG